MKFIIRQFKEDDTVIDSVQKGSLLTIYDEEKTPRLIVSYDGVGTVVIVLDPWKFQDWERPKDEKIVEPIGRQGKKPN